MKTLFGCLLCLAPLLLFGQQPNLSMTRLAGNWQMERARVTLDYQGPGMLASEKIYDKNNFEDIGFASLYDELRSDSTYTEVLLDSEGEEIDQYEGQWWVYSDSIIFIDKNGTHRFRVEKTEEGARMTTLGDWDADGSEDDLIIVEMTQLSGEMTTYWMVFLYRGEKGGDYSSEERNEIQKGHLQNIGKLAEEGKLVLAGPFMDQEDLRGIFIMDVNGKEELEQLMETDPAIEAGTLRVEYRPWYGPTALRGLF